MHYLSLSTELRTDGITDGITDEQIRPSIIIDLSAQDETTGDKVRMSLCRINQISWLTWCSAARLGGRLASWFPCKECGRDVTWRLEPHTATADWKWVRILCQAGHWRGSHISLSHLTLSRHINTLTALPETRGGHMKTPTRLTYFMYSKLVAWWRNQCHQVFQ